MADTTTATTATPPTPERDTNDVGIFTSTSAIGFVEPSVTTIGKIEAKLKEMFVKTPPAKDFLKALMTIKMLAPQESRDLIIYNLPQAVAIIKQLEQKLLHTYYEQ